MNKSLIKKERYYDESTKICMGYIVINNDLWFDYDMVINTLHHDSHYMDFHYRNKIDNNNKGSIEVIDIDGWGYEYKTQTRFISRFALHDLIEKDIKLYDDIKDCVNNMEMFLGIIQPGDSNNQELKINIELMLHEVESQHEDYSKLAQMVKDVCDSELIQDIINKHDFEYDPSNDPYPVNPALNMDDCDINNSSIKSKICEAIDNNELKRIDLIYENNTHIRYRKHKKLKGESKCPDKEWFRELL